MEFKIYGNTIAKQILMQGLHSDKIAHAYLIYGDKGLGKKTFARYFAMSVLCQSQGNAPCLVCNACKKILSNIHPDYKEYISPERKMSMGVDFVRELRKDCIIKPNESSKKVYVITDIQNMTLQAHNAFLKTLEEPPKNTLFLLTATNLNEVPETIVSRLVPVQMFPLTDKELKNALDDKVKDIDKLKEETQSINLKYIDEISRESKGNLGRALVSLTDSFIVEDIEKLNQFCKNISKKNEYGVMLTLNLYEKDKSGLMKLLNLFGEELSMALIRKLSLSEDVSENAKELSKKLAKIEIIGIIEFISSVKAKLETNVNYNLLLSYICSGIFEILD